MEKPLRYALEKRTYLAHLRPSKFALIKPFFFAYLVQTHLALLALCFKIKDTCLVSYDCVRSLHKCLLFLAYLVNSVRRRTPNNLSIIVKSLVDYKQLLSVKESSHSDGAHPITYLSSSNLSGTFEEDKFGGVTITNNEIPSQDYILYYREILLFSDDYEKFYASATINGTEVIMIYTKK